MNIPANLKYTKSHEWIEVLEGNKIRVGITDFAQNALGGIVFVNLPEAGDEIGVDESFSDVESVKAVSDVNAPATGTISAINEELLDTPEKINEDPYGAWLIEMSDYSELLELLDADEYEVFCREEE